MMARAIVVTLVIALAAAAKAGSRYFDDNDIYTKSGSKYINNNGYYDNYADQNGYVDYDTYGDNTKYGGNNNYGDVNSYDDYNNNYNNYGDNVAYGKYDFTNDYLNKYHGMKLINGGFTYGGKGYRLSCSENRFYGLWNSCYGRLHSRNLCIGQLQKKHVFAVYSADYNNNYNDYGDNVAYGKYDFTNDYLNKYHGMTLINGGFTYGGKGYRLSCSENRFYGLWNSCYGRLHSRSLCIGQLQKKHVFAVYSADYNNNYNDYGDNVAYGKYDFTNDYLNKFHGMTLINGGFTYGGKGYRLSCSENRFYGLWNSCYGRLHSRSLCIGQLLKKHVFALYSAPAMISAVSAKLVKQLKVHKNIAKKHIMKVNRIAKAHVAVITKLAKTHVGKLNNTAKKHVGTIAVVASKHINKINDIVKAHISKIKKQVKINLHAVHVQHQKHMADRHHQHQAFLKQKEYLTQKHKAIIAAKMYGTSKYQPGYGRRKYTNTVVTVTHKRKAYGRVYNSYGHKG